MINPLTAIMAFIATVDRAACCDRVKEVVATTSP